MEATADAVALVAGLGAGLGGVGLGMLLGMLLGRMGGVGIAEETVGCRTCCTICCGWFVRITTLEVAGTLTGLIKPPCGCCGELAATVADGFDTAATGGPPC